MTRFKETPSILIKDQSIKNIEQLEKYAPNNRCSKYMKQK